MIGLGTGIVGLADSAIGGTPRTRLGPAGRWQSENPTATTYYNVKCFLKQKKKKTARGLVLTRECCKTATGTMNINIYPGTTARAWCKTELNARRRWEINETTKTQTNCQVLRSSSNFLNAIFQSFSFYCVCFVKF